MLLNDETIWAIPDGASGIEFYDKEAGNAFVEIFNKQWEFAVERVATEHEDCLRDNPASVKEIRDHLLVSFVPLDIPFMDDEYCDTEQGCNALKRAVKEWRSVYPDERFRGCIQFAWSDSRGGDVIKFDISSEESDEAYPFVGEILRIAVDDEDEYFWEKVEESDDIEGMAKDLDYYRSWVGEDAIDRISELLE